MDYRSKSRPRRQANEDQFAAYEPCSWAERATLMDSPSAQRRIVRLFCAGMSKIGSLLEVLLTTDECR
jgi:hypothetical protein